MYYKWTACAGVEKERISPACLTLQPLVTPFIVDKRCSLCDLNCSSNEAALDHYKTVHLNCRYICHKCTKQYDGKSTLDTHQRDVYSPCNAATGSRLLKNASHKQKLSIMRAVENKHCELCKRRFGTVDEIEVHFERQHGWKIFFCKCEKGFMSKQALYRHKTECKKKVILIANRLAAKI